MPTEAELRERQRRDKRERERKRKKKGALRALLEAVRKRLNVLNARIAARRKKIDALDDGVRGAVKWALAQVGTREIPEGSNRGPKVDVWNVATLGYSGFSWCQSFVNAVLKAGGGEQLKSAYTVAVIQWANENRYGLKRVPISDRKPGDFIYFKWPGVSGDFADHVGVDVGGGWTVEGNTSPGTTGSQNNGQGVWKRLRGNAYVVAVVRPTYG